MMGKFEKDRSVCLQLYELMCDGDHNAKQRIGAQAQRPRKSARRSEFNGRIENEKGMEKGMMHTDAVGEGKGKEKHVRNSEVRREKDRDGPSMTKKQAKKKKEEKACRLRTPHGE